MATKDMKQPFWLHSDKVTVMGWGDDGKRTTALVAADPSEAIALCDLCNANYQYLAYGAVDAASDLTAAAKRLGHPLTA